MVVRVILRYRLDALKALFGTDNESQKYISWSVFCQTNQWPTFDKYSMQRPNSDEDR